MVTKTSPAQEAAAISWIDSELQRYQDTNNLGELTPPLPAEATSLCEFLRDGRALCLLANAVAADLNLGDEHKFPKKLERAMHQLATFHSLERIHYFIRWCRNAVQLEEQHIFTSVQLLDEANADAVYACIDALRQRSRPKSVDEVTNGTVAATSEPAPQPTDENDDYGNIDTTPSPLASSSTSTSNANKLSAFLNKFPSDTPAAPAAGERTSLTNRFSSSSTTSSTMRDLSSSIISDLVDDDDADGIRISAISNPSPRSGGTISKLKMPLAFTSSASNSPTKEEEVVVKEIKEEPPVKETKEEKPVVSKLEIPSVFGRQRSLSNTEDSSSATTTEEPPKPTARSVSKLQIPSAFSSGAPASLVAPPPQAEPPAPPSPKVAVPSSPRSKLDAFTKGFSSPSPAPPPTENDVTQSPSTEKKKPAKLKIPKLFGPAVASMQPAPVVKRASKLAAFISTVEAANDLIADSANVPAAVAVMKEEVPPPQEEVEEEVVEDEVADVEEEVVESAPEPVAAPPPSTKSKLLAFLAATEPTPAPVEVVATPQVDVTEDVAVEEPVAAAEVVEEPQEVAEEVVEESFAAVEEQTPVPVDEHAEPELPAAPAPPASQRSSKLLAFLAVVPPPAADIVEEPETVQVEAPETHDAIDSHDHNEDDYATTPMIDVSGEVVHEELASPPPSPRKLHTPRSSSPKKQAARELFPDPEPSTDVVPETEPVAAEPEEVAAPEPTAVATVPSVAEEVYNALKEAKDQVDAQNEALATQLEEAKALAESRNDELTALKHELESLRAQLIAQKTESEATLAAAVEQARREAAERAALKEEQHNQALAAVQSQLDNAKIDFEEKLRTSQVVAEERLVEVSQLKEQLEDQERQLQMAKDSEEAARYSAQMAFAARDEAEDASRVLQEKIDQLTRAA